MSRADPCCSCFSGFDFHRFGRTREVLEDDCVWHDRTLARLCYAHGISVVVINYHAIVVYGPSISLVIKKLPLFIGSAFYGFCKYETSQWPCRYENTKCKTMIHGCVCLLSVRCDLHRFRLEYYHTSVPLDPVTPKSVGTFLAHFSQFSFVSVAWISIFGIPSPNYPLT